MDRNRRTKVLKRNLMDNKSTCLFPEAVNAGKLYPTGSTIEVRKGVFFSLEPPVYHITFRATLEEPRSVRGDQKEPSTCWTAFCGLPKVQK